MTAEHNREPLPEDGVNEAKSAPGGDEVPQVSVAEALQKVYEGGVFIDVRSQAEYESGHIPGAKLVFMPDLNRSWLEAIWGTDPLAMIDPQTPKKAIVVVSKTPAHAYAVTHQLRDQGANAYLLAGGLVAWVLDHQFLLPGPPR